VWHVLLLCFASRIRSTILWLVASVFIVTRPGWPSWPWFDFCLGFQKAKSDKGALYSKYQTSGRNAIHLCFLLFIYFHLSWKSILSGLSFSISSS
jgi:hypothetical protein